MIKKTPREWYNLFPDRLKALIPTHEPILENQIEMTCKIFILFCLDVVESGSAEEEKLEALYAWLYDSPNPDFEQYEL